MSPILFTRGTGGLALELHFCSIIRIKIHMPKLYSTIVKEQPIDLNITQIGSF